MSAHRRMKTYMERHKVGSLFEDLMSKLVSEMPHDPVPFLIKLLQHKQCQVTPQSVMTVAQLRRSLGDLASSLEVEKVPVHRKPSSAVIKRSRPSAPSTPTHCHQKSVTLFCPESKGTVEADRSTKSRPTTPSKSRGHSAPKLRQELTVGPPASAPSPAESQPRNLPLKATKSYHRQSENRLSMNKFPECYQAVGYSGPILPGQVTNQDPLKDEVMVIVTQDKNQDKLGDDRSYQQSRKPCEPRTFSRTEKRFNESDHNTDGNGDTNVIEMYEDPEDLISEGIYLFPATGFKVGSNKIQTRNLSCQHWHFNVCSVCAKVFKYRESSEVPTCCLGICYPRPVVPVGRPTTVPMVEMITADNSVPNSRNQMQLKLPSKPAKSYGEISADTNHGVTINTGHFANDAQPSPSLLDTGRSLSTEDLFATPRSLPLPRSPSENKVKIEWCVPILDSIHDRACGWDVLNSHDSDVF